MKKTERMMRWVHALFAIFLSLWLATGLMMLIQATKIAPTPGAAP